MAEPARFTPEELDRIEDALEDLEGVHAIEDPSPQVRDVLASYLGVMVAAREALPQQEVPQGALAAVFAEARGAATASTQVADTASPKTRPGFFERLRKSFLVPSLALAGSAALVLWISRPQDDNAMDQPMSAATAAKSEEVLPASTRPMSVEVDGEIVEQSAEEEQSKLGVIAKPEAEPTAAPAPEPVLDAADVPTASPSAKQEQAIAESRADRAPAKPTGGEQPSRDANDSKPAWGVVERADRARQTGDCAAAHSDYLIATEDDSAAVRARAYAGLGLCNMQQGDDAGAEDAFERARGIDPGVEGFINAERDPEEYNAPVKAGRKRKSAKPVAKPKSKPKASSKSSQQKKSAPVSVDEVSNPFSP